MRKEDEAPVWSEEESKGDFDIKDLISFVWRLRWWIVGSVFVAFVVAFLYLRMTSPVYSRNASVILNNDKNSAGSELSILSDLTGMSTQSNAENEMFIMKSPSLMSKVVEALGLNYRYYQYRLPIFHGRMPIFRRFLNIKKYEFYRDNPISLHAEFDPLYPKDSLPKAISVDIIVKGGNAYSVKELDVTKSSTEKVALSNSEYHYGDTIKLSGFSIVVACSDTKGLIKNDKYLCTWSDPYLAARSFVGNLTVSNSASKATLKTDVILLSFEDVKPKRAEDILNTLILDYNRESKEYKNIASINTINFIDTRIEAISRELGNVESSFRNYQASNVLVNIDAQSQITLSSDVEYEKQLTEIRLQRTILKILRDDMDNAPQGEFKIIPTNIGIADAGLNEAISNYNTVVAQRNQLLANSSARNPRVINLNEQLKDVRSSIELTLDNLNKVYSAKETELNSSLSASKRKMSNIPTQQLDLAQMARKQEIIEPLYRLLQQKKEEAQIALYSITDNVRIIETAYGGGPIKPRTSIVFLLALIIGCVLPPCIVWLRSVLKTKVETKEDVTAVVKAPVLASIPKSDDSGIITTAGGRSIKSESFRMLRSSLQYIKGTVIQVTSSVPGEGKSYVSANLAVALSHIGKNVVLVGCDLRKPIFGKYFKNITASKVNSVVGYLIGKVDDLSVLAVPVNEAGNLNVVFSGPVPPNPSELLSLERFETLMEYLRSNFDYVICDSAPYFPVSDAALVNRFVDSTIYVVRSEYTDLKILKEIQSCYEADRLKNINIVINNLDLESRKFRYGYGYGYGKYGYGYGKYGYGYGYGSSSKGGGEKSKDR